MRLIKYVFLSLLISTLFACKQKSQLTGSNIKSKILSEQEKLKLDREFYTAAKEKILGNYLLAQAHYQECIKTDPTHSASLYEMASIYYMQGKDELALKHAKKAAELEPSNQWYQMLTSTLYSKTGDFDSAAKIYKKLVKDYPQNIEYALDLASSYFYMSNYKAALEIYNDIEKQIGINEEISLQKNRILLKTGNINAAIDELKKLIALNPKEPRYYGMLAELYQSQGMDDKAMETYDKLVEIDPTNATINVSLSNYYRTKGDNYRAHEEMKKAFNNPELNIDVKVQILLEYYVGSEKDEAMKTEAMELAEILCQTHPKEAKAHSIYADFLMREKKTQEAKDHYKKAVELDKSKFVIWNQLMFLDNELKDFDSMIKESEEAMELFPNQAVFYFFNGFGNIQKKNYEPAIKSLAQGKELVIENDALLGQFYANLGDVYHRVKNYSLSDSSYNQALKINPKDTYVLNNYSYYLSLREENLDKAEEMSKLSNELEPNSASFADTYGWILYQQNNYLGAKEWISKAIQYGGAENDVILEHFGDILYKLNDIEQALEYWNKALRKGEGSEFLKKKIMDKKLYE